MRPRGIAPWVCQGEFLGVNPTTGRGAGRRDTEDIEELVRRLIDERSTEIYSRLKEDMDRRFAALEERLAQRNIDERSIRTLVRAFAGQEFARLHSIVMEEITRVRGEVEALARQGVDVEVIKRLVEDAYGKVLDDVKRILDQRIAHIISVIDERSNEVRDVLDLVNEVLKLEVEFEEELAKLRGELRSMLSEEALEEHLYRALIRHGIIRRRKRGWVPLIAGLSVLAAIIAGFIINPIVTFVIIAIVFVILLRW